MIAVANAAFEIIPADATAIGGLTMGADPVAYGIAAVGATQDAIYVALAYAKKQKTTESLAELLARCNLAIE